MYYIVDSSTGEVLATTHSKDEACLAATGTNFLVTNGNGEYF